jgi:hypothetical protein
VGEAGGLADAHLTVPSLRDGPLSLPPQAGGEGKLPDRRRRHQQGSNLRSPPPRGPPALAAVDPMAFAQPLLYAGLGGYASNPRVPVTPFTALLL